MSKTQFNPQRMQRDGFIVLEYIVYFFLFTFLIVCIFSWVIGLHFQLKNKSQDSILSIEHMTAQDLLMRDLMQVPAKIINWKRQTQHELIWQGDKVDVGWAYEDGKLFRFEGKYNERRLAWEDKTKSLVAHKIDYLAFELKIITINDVKLVQTIMCSLNKQSIIVVPRNRMWNEEID